MRHTILIVTALAFTFGSFASAQLIETDDYSDRLGPIPRFLKLPEPAVCECDVTGDGVVDVNDFLAAYDAWGTVGDVPADVNGDEVVDIDDLIAIVENFGLCTSYRARSVLVEATRGMEMSGNLVCLCASDNHRFRICALPHDGVSTAARIVCHGRAKTATRLDLTVETGVNRSGVETFVCLWNFATERYDFIDRFDQPLTDTVRFYPHIPSPYNYVSDTGLVVLRLRTKAAADAPTHVLRIDHVEVMVTP